MLDFMVSKTGIKTYAYYLPSSAEEDASESVHETTVNSVIIIGANGAGKVGLELGLSKSILKICKEYLLYGIYL